MAQETKPGILRFPESLWDVALRSIGIQLPDEYVLRFTRLLTAAKDMGIDKVTLADIADIERDCREEVKKRLKEQEDKA